MPRVGIVVPVYNGEAYLFDCLASIAAQTYSDWEAIIVNNCSTDRTGKIADLFAQQDSRFSVVHCSEFLSQPENYNRAVSFGVARAEYLKIVEADNEIWPECLEKMVTLAERDPQIGLVGCYWFHGKGLKGEAVPPEKKILEGSEVRREHLVTDVYYLGTPTTLLFRVAALPSTSPCFRPGLFFDDVDLCFRVLRDWKFGFVHQVLVFVRDDNQGIFDAFAEFDYIPTYRYLLAIAYGRELFDRPQAKAIIVRRKSAYYRKLGVAVLDARPRTYWSFHQKAFRVMGCRLSYFEVIRWVPRVILERIYDSKPVVIIRGPARRLKRWCLKTLASSRGADSSYKKTAGVFPTSK
jgi:glycosyltransferase involved in cell wall biosynthesis